VSFGFGYFIPFPAPYAATADSAPASHSVGNYKSLWPRLIHIWFHCNSYVAI
jgi:hypothetical protein